ncbi:MAG: HAD-IA family hydrolase [Sphaerochaetaceae bacterium]|nr:HAD-IA family hydrolase [Sphaerochaetaceae bacterium]
MKKRGVLFDLDGTLVFTLEDIQKALNYAISTFYGNEENLISLDECRQSVGHGLKNLVKTALFVKGLNPKESEIKTMYNLLMEYYTLHPSDFSYAYQGVFEMLDLLKKKDFIIGIFSNKKDELVRVILKKVFPSFEFDFILGMGGGFKAKPDCEGLDYFRKLNNLNKDECIYIGDSEVDYKTGQQGGVETIIVGWGFRNETDLMNAGINESYIVDNVDKLVKRVVR